MNTIDRQSAQFTDLLPGTIARQPKSQVAYDHQLELHPCTPPAQQPPAIITHTHQVHRQILSANAAQCKAQAG